MVDLESGLKNPTYDEVEIPENFGPVTVQVDEFKMKRFAFTQDDYSSMPNSDFQNNSTIASAGILANDLLQMFTTKYAPSDVVGLHTEEELWFYQPIKMNSEAILNAKYVEKYEKRGQGYVVMEAEARTISGQTLLKHRGTEIIRTAPAEIGGRGAASQSSGSKSRVNPIYPEMSEAFCYFNQDVRIGMHIKPLVKFTTMEQVAIFSRYGEFISSIHTNLQKARANNLDLPIVQGQQLVCYFTELLSIAFGDDWYPEGHLHVKFLEPAKVFDVIELNAVVVDIIETSSKHEYRLELWAKSDRNRLNAIGWAQASIMKTEIVSSKISKGVE